MKLYLAGVYTSNFHLQSQLFARMTPREQEARLGVKFFLESHHYVHKQSYVDKMVADGVKVFLDSGAFSAFTKGVTVDIKGYCNYIKKHEAMIVKDDGVLCASVLDGIGNPLLTWQNQKAMEQLGVRPLPCFHYGEDERYLEYYIANYEYITLGGMVPISNPQLFYWLDRIWEKYLTDGSGRPRLKVHGFGLTAQPLMMRYPWYSVDSSSWVQAAAMGNILFPGIGIFAVSSTSPAGKKANQHLNTIAKPQRDRLIKIIEDNGFDPERVQHEYVARWSWNCWAFTKVNEALANKEYTFFGDQIGIF